MNENSDDGRSLAPAAFCIHFDKSPFSGHANLLGAGELLIGPGEIEIRGRARRPFRRSRDVTLRIRLDSLRNVVHDGTQTYLEAYFAGEKPQRLVFRAENSAAAEQIAALIPPRQTAEFGKALTEFRDFRERLLTVSPTARLTPVLIGVNVVVFLAMAAAGAGVFNLNPEVHVHWGSNLGPRTVAGEWWRLASSMFVHFGIIHLLLNMWVLRLYGELAERLYGSVHYLALYLLAGIAGSLTSIWWHPEVNSAGASGAIFGIFGGLVAFVARRRNQVPPSIMVAHRNSMLVFIGMNLLFGFVYPGIDNAAHLGGLATGFVLGLGLGRPLDIEYRHQHRFRALATVVVSAAVLLTLVALGVARIGSAWQEDQQFHEDLAWFDEREAVAMDAFEALVTGVDRREITTPDFLKRMDQDILPFWEEASQRFAQRPISFASRHAEFRRTLRDYVMSRRAMVQAVVAGFRLEGAEFQAARAEAEKANALALELRRLRASYGSELAPR